MIILYDLPFINESWLYLCLGFGLLLPVVGCHILGIIGEGVEIVGHYGFGVAPIFIVASTSIFDVTVTNLVVAICTDIIRIKGVRILIIPFLGRINALFLMEIALFL